MKRLIKGSTYSAPAPVNPCHLAVNGIIVDKVDTCEHGEIGDTWNMSVKGSMKVTEVDHKNKTITFEIAK